MIVKRETSNAEAFYDEAKGIVKPYIEVSEMVEWKTLSPKDKLDFIHDHINPDYIKEKYTPPVNNVRFKLKAKTHAVEESEEKIQKRQEDQRIELDRRKWTIEYENLLRQKVFWKLKFRIEEQKGGKRKARYLERRLQDLKILQASDLESNLLTSIIRDELDYWKMHEDDSEDKVSIENSITKLKTNASPSVFGFLITELVNKGFLEAPLRGGEINYTGLAKLCYSIFDTGSTLENIIKEINPKKASLSDVKRAKFSIPNITDLH